MRLLTTPVLWMVAAVLVACVVLSGAERRRRLLRWMPSAMVPIVATLVVALGLGQEGHAQGEPKVAVSERPAGFAIDETMASNRLLARRNQKHLVHLKRLLVAPVSLSERDRHAAHYALRRLPERAREVLVSWLASRDEGVAAPVAVGAVTDALDAMERAGLVDGWLAWWFWNRTSTATGSADLVECYARLRRHVRMDETLLKATAKVTPFSPRAWASKAGGPRPAVVRVRSRELVLEAVRLWEATADGPWNRAGRVALRVGAGSAAIHVRRGQARARVAAGERFVFGRLDLIEVPAEGAVLEHDGVGRVTLSGGSVVTPWSLASGLDGDGRARLGALVQRALVGDEAALDALEAALPLALRAMDRGLATATRPKGAPGLRQLRLLFTGLPAPTPPPPLGRGR